MPCISVNGLGGALTTLELPEYAQPTVVFVKEAIEGATGIPFEEQHLLVEGLELADSDVVTGDVVTLVRAPADRSDAPALEVELFQRGYTLVRQLEQGSFGRRSRAAVVRCAEGRRVADIIGLNAARSDSEESEILRITEAWMEPRAQRHLVQVCEGFVVADELCIVKACEETRTLADEVSARRNLREHFQEEQIWKWLSQAACALLFLHQRCVLHRDLSLGRFLVSADGDLRLLPGRLSLSPAESDWSTSRNYTRHTEMWHFGAVAFELCALFPPCGDATETTTITCHPAGRDLCHPSCGGSVPRTVWADFPGLYSDDLRHLCAKLLDGSGAHSSCTDLLHGLAFGLDEGCALPDCPYASSAGTYSKSAQLEYYSDTHGKWLPADVTDVDAYNRILVNLKPNTWLPMDVQAKRVRPRNDSSLPPAHQSLAKPAKPTEEDELTLLPPDVFQLVHKRDNLRANWECLGPRRPHGC